MYILPLERLWFEKILAIPMFCSSDLAIYFTSSCSAFTVLVSNCIPLVLCLELLTATIEPNSLWLV